MAYSHRIRRLLCVLIATVALAGQPCSAQTLSGHQLTAQQPVGSSSVLAHSPAQMTSSHQAAGGMITPSKPAASAATLSAYQSLTTSPTPQHYVSPLARRAAVGATPSALMPSVHPTVQMTQPKPMQLPAINVPITSPAATPPVAPMQAMLPGQQTQQPAGVLSGHSFFGPSNGSTFATPNAPAQVPASGVSYSQTVPAAAATYSAVTPEQVFSQASCNCMTGGAGGGSPVVAGPMPQAAYAPLHYSGCNPVCPPAASCADAGLFGFPNELLPCLKNSPNGNLLASVGGELRYRFMDEANRLRPPGPGSSQYDLWRFTPWMEIQAGQRVRFYGQMIDASAFGYDAPYSPLPIDENRGDLLQAYADIKISENLHYRYGRQFLKYGSQRLLSPLAWSNTYRNFEGHRLYYSGSAWDIDLFNMRTVNAAAGNRFRPTSFDTANANRQISGLYTTYHGTPNRTWDFYWLWFDGTRSVNLQDGDRHTVGLRWAGKQPICGACGPSASDWHWDFEGAFQVGEDDFGAVADADVFAGFLALSGGRTFGGLPWNPTVDGIFYYGSGDGDPTDNTINTFYTMFPLGHAYWGLIDQFSGQNLLNFGLQTSFRPTKRLTLGVATHWFSRANSDDAVYNIAGASIAAGTPGSYIGSEIDLTARLKVSDALSFELGQFWFIYGDAIDNSTPRNDARQLYFMSTLTF